jgi:hypothetical protein
MHILFIVLDTGKTFIAFSQGKKNIISDHTTLLFVSKDAEFYKDVCFVNFETKTPLLPHF